MGVATRKTHHPPAGPSREPELIPEPFALDEALVEVAREISWTLDVDLRFERSERVEVIWDRRRFKEAIWLLCEPLLPLSTPPGHGTLRYRHTFGWVQVELVIPGNPLGSEELADLIRHCHGERFAGRHLFRKALVRNIDEVRPIVEAHGGRVSLMNSPAAGTVFALSLPTRILPPDGHSDGPLNC